MNTIKRDAMYIQIAKKIMMDIYDEKICKGENLLTVRDYTSKYKVTIRTIQNSFEYLLENGIIEKSGKKTIMIVDKDYIKNLHKNEAVHLTNEFIHKLELIGYKDKAITLVKENGGNNND